MYFLKNDNDNDNDDDDDDDDDDNDNSNIAYVFFWPWDNKKMRICETVQLACRSNPPHAQKKKKKNLTTVQFNIGR
jgi:hypothetical protein